MTRTDADSESNIGSDSRGRENVRRSHPSMLFGGRKPMSAGHALLAVLVAFVVGTLLNATGMYRTAANQDAGFKRDFAMSVMRPIRWISTHTGLSKPREILLSAVGQADEDNPDTTFFKPSGTSKTTVPTTRPPADGPGPTTSDPPSPPGETVPGATTVPTTTVPTTAAPTPVALPVMTPARPLNMLIVGDSLVATPGKQFLRIAGDSKVIGVLNGVDSRTSTGLGRPDFVVNWAVEVKSQLERFRPDLVMVMIGANDDHTLQTGSCNGKDKGPFQSPAWEAEYRCRVGGLMDLVVSHGARMLWVGIPIVRDAGQAARFQYLNSIYASESAARADRVTFIDTYSLLQPKPDGSPGGTGGYADYLTIDGNQVKVRADDGVHFGGAGGRIIADAVLAVIRRSWDVDSWRLGIVPDTTTTAPTTAVPTTAPPTTAVPTTPAPTTAAPTTAPTAAFTGPLGSAGP